MEKYFYFWRKESPFSQWHRSTYQANGFTYNCSEQYMMHHKALLMKDTETAEEIMATPYNPARYKQLGRQVKPFYKDLWDANCQAIVYQASYLKFTQNPHLLEELKKTKGTTLVEASPHDPIWGIGLAATDPRAKYRNTWKGQNLLGEALTKLRKNLEAEGIL